MQRILNTQIYVAVSTFIPAGAGAIFHEVVVVDAANRVTQTYWRKFNDQVVADVFAEKLVARLTKNPQEQLHPATWIPSYFRNEFEGVSA